MFKESRLIRFLSILALFPILLLGSAGVSARNSGSNSIYLPLVLKNYESWSTNFASVTDLVAAGIRPGGGTSAVLDTTNVHSGGKSIKAYGTIGQVGSILSLGFDLWGVVGQNQVDLSKDTLSIEAYLPADSPIYQLLIFVFSNDKFVIIRTAHDAMYRGQWHTYSVDICEDIILKTWRTNSYLTSSGLTDAQAVDVLENAQTIVVMGMVLADRTPAESYFLVDRMGWESAGPAPAYNPALESLQQYAPANLPMGGLMEPDGAAEPEYVRNFVQEFNAMQAWGLFPKTEPARDVFTYDQSWSPMPYADYFNETQGFPLIRYTGIGENPLWIPAWLPGKSDAQAQTILEDYIHALVDHYKGKTDIWILFNEILRYDTNNYTGLGLKSRDRSPQTAVNDYSPWSEDSSDVHMIEAAFSVARAADPGALLIINEGTSAAEGTVSGEALYKLAGKLKDDHTPIDGVGFEAHFDLGQDGNFHGGSIYGPIAAFDPVYGFTGIAENVDRYAALGLKVAFTEVNFPIYLADIENSTPAGQALLAQRRALQAAAYRSLLHIALTHPNVVFFNIWDWADEYSYDDQEWGWQAPPGFGNDLGLFDLSYQKKPSYYAMLDELKATQTPLPGAFNKLSPADESTDQSTVPSLSWGASMGATGYEYCIDTSKDNGCSTAWISTGTGTSVAVSLLPLTTYSWQVRATNASGVTHADHGAWRSFTTGSDWSTNFANLTDLVAANIFSPDANTPVVIDTTNVNSGGKSIKISGPLGQTVSVFNLNFGTMGLISHASVDLSTKIVSYDIYLPADSPQGELNFFMFYNNQYVVISHVLVDALKGAWHTYTVDISQVIAEKSWHAASWMTSPGLTDDEAVTVLENIQQITIIGNPSAGQTSAGTYFLVDRLGWEASAP